MSSIVIENVRLIDPANGRDDSARIVIHDGRVLRIDSGDSLATIRQQAHANALPGAERRESSRSGDEVIDGRGLYALPGFVDLYARLREPGLTRQGSLKSEAHAALHGGITTIAATPDTVPVIDNTATVELVRQRASAAAGARVVPMAALTMGLEGQQLSEMATLFNAGCLAFTQADRPISDSGVLLRAMEYAATFDLPLMLHPRDLSIARDGCAHAGEIATRLGLTGIPVSAETVGLARLLELARDTGCRLHLSRLSSARAVTMLHEAREKGLRISADVGISHLFFTDFQLAGYDARFHSAVPFRGVEDRAALRDAVRDGTIDAICSDHAPLDPDARLAPFAATEPGLSTFDSFLPLLLALPDMLEMSLSDVIERVSSAPASILLGSAGSDARRVNAGLLRAGTLSPQANDLLLIDPAAAAPISTGTMFSRGTNSPLLGVRELDELTGEPIQLAGRAHTVLAGGRLFHFMGGSD